MPLLSQPSMGNPIVFLRTSDFRRFRLWGFVLKRRDFEDKVVGLCSGRIVGFGAGVY